MLDDALLVDDEQAAQGDAVVGEDAERGRHLLLEVSHQGVLQVAQAAGLAVRLHPGQVGELAVHGDAQHLGVHGLELAVAVAERRDLRRAHKRKVQRVEEQHHVPGRGNRVSMRAPAAPAGGRDALPTVLAQLHLDELLVKHSLRREVRRRVANQRLDVRLRSAVCGGEPRRCSKMHLWGQAFAGWRHSRLTPLTPSCL